MELPGISANLSHLKLGRGLDFAKLTTMGAPLGAIGISILILLFVVWPKLSEALRLRASNEQLATQAEALSVKAQTLSSLDETQLHSQLGSSEQILPSEKAVFAFVSQVELAAARNGVLLNKVDVAPGSLVGDSGDATPKAGETADPAPKIQVKTALTSDYKSLLNFLVSMYSVSRVIGVRDFTISSGAAEEGAATLRSSLVVDAYWKPLPTQLGSIESAVTTLTREEEEILKRAKAAEVSSPPTVVPTVPTGRPDLFAPF